MERKPRRALFPSRSNYYSLSGYDSLPEINAARGNGLGGCGKLGYSRRSPFRLKKQIFLWPGYGRAVFLRFSRILAHLTTTFKPTTKLQSLPCLMYSVRLSILHAVLFFCILFGLEYDRGDHLYRYAMPLTPSGSTTNPSF